MNQDEDEEKKMAYFCNVLREKYSKYNGYIK